MSEEEDMYYNIKECSNVYTFKKDGKLYYGNLDEEVVEKLNRK